MLTPNAATRPAVVLAGTAMAMVAFAANSLLCRLALGNGSIDAASFTFVRLATGAVALAALAGARARRRAERGADDALPRGAGWVPALLLFLYAAPFSVAYLRLSAGTGALILFGSVQVTMLGVGWISGERPSAREWIGLAAALGGLTWLVLPGVRAPSAGGAVAMSLAGVSWGLYTLRGRGTSDPLAATARNFVRSVPFAALFVAVSLGRIETGTVGLLWAALSGVLASGAGYAIWYAVLPGLTATRAATVQLSVPVLAALGGTWVLDEPIGARLAIAGVAVLGGIALAVSARARVSAPAANRA